MANHKSSEKRARQTIKKNARNTVVRTKVKTAVRVAREALASKPTEAVTEVRKAVAAIQKAVSKGVLHHRTGARKVSRIMKGQKP